MENRTISSVLLIIRWACYAVAFTGLILAAAAAITFYMGVDSKSYWLIVNLCVAIYFSGVTLQAVRASWFTENEQKLPQALRYLSLCVIALLIPVCLLVVLFIWVLFQPVY